MRRAQQTLRLAALLLAGLCIFGGTSAFLFPVSSRGAPRTQVRVVDVIMTGLDQGVRRSI